MNAHFKMNSFAKKSLGVCVVLQLAVLALSAQKVMNLGSLPLWFEASPGPADVSSQFVAHGCDSEFLISSSGAEIVLRETGGKTVSTHMQFVGVNPSAGISGDAGLGGKINYLIGNDPARWQPGLAAFVRVRVEKIYPGINVVYYGNQQRLEYDFELAPGVKPEAIVIRFDGADKISVNDQGELVVKLDGREIIQHQPVAYQVSGNNRHAVQVGYKILDARTVAFSVGRYDSQLPLVIDPVLAYSTFFGGNNNDIAWAVALDTNDNSVYIAGQTLSTKITSTLPFATPGAFQTNFPGGRATGDAFVAKFNNSATNLIYCTYLGGSGADVAKALAVDAAGHAFVAGATLSTNFPVKNYVVYQNFNGSKIAGQFDPTVNLYPSDAFVSELETNGSSLIYSTYLGGESSDAALGLALDPDDNVYVTGYTYSTNFPVTSNALMPKFASVNNFYLGCNAFVAEIPAGGNTLNYSSYLGGTNVDVGYAIAFNNDYVAVAGSTCSSNFPAINSIQQYVSTNDYYNGSLLNGRTNNVNNNLQITPFVTDAFVTLFQANGTGLSPLYSTFLGGTNTDLAYGVAVDPSGNAYVVGGTTSTNFPSSTNGVALSSYVQTNTTGLFITNAFLTQIQWTGGHPYIGYSRTFGGFGNDVATGVALDAAGNVFIGGFTSSWTNYNATTGNLIGALSYTNTALGGNNNVNVFVTAFKSDFSGLLYSADFGSSSGDWGYGIAVDAADSVYVVGQTKSSTGSSIGFPVFNAWEPIPPDDNNGFLTKIWLAPPALPELTTTNTGTNLLVSWSAVPLAQINANTFYLETTTNLISGVLFTTNLVSTNVIISTSLIGATNWTIVKQKPFSTNEIVGGITNQTYTYTFDPTNQMRFFRLQSTNY